MCELRTIGAELTATPLVPTPPLSAVQARANGYVAARRRRNALAMSIVVGLTMTGVVKLGMGPTSDAVRMVGTPPGHEEPTTTTTTIAPTGLPDLYGETSFLPWSGQAFEGNWSSLPRRGSGNCTAGPVDPQLPSIKILAHEPSTPMSPSPREAVRRVYDSVNDRLGGICGRALELVDGSLTNIPKEVVAVVGLPLDKVLDDAIASGRFDRAGIPVVGGDGLSAVQHASPAVYPVGTSAAALARTAVRHAWERGARSFAVVHDASRPLGTEAATAVAEYVARLGGTLKVTVAVDPNAAVHTQQSEQFGRACANSGCDFVFLALLPDTAASWLMGNPHVARIEMSALPTLLTSGFADTCFRTSNQRCDGITAWSGFIPPFGDHAANLEALYAWNPTGAEGGSAMVEAAVVSARVLHEALEQVGPNVSRTALRRALDSFTFRSSLTAPLRWSPGAPRVGNPTAQAWRLQVNGVARADDASEAAGRAGGNADHNARAAGEMQPDDDPNEAGFEAPWVPHWSWELPRREWHEAGTGWRSDPQ